MTNIEELKTSVVVSGAGPAGLCLAIELGMRGVPCIVLDCDDEPSKAYKANATQARTMEHFRRMGLADEVRLLGLPKDYPTDVAYFTRYSKFELARIRLPAAKDVDDMALQSTGSWSTPELPHRCNQVYVERVLREHANRYATNRLRFGWRVTEFEGGDESVTVKAVGGRDDDELQISCDYFVGCDGARSLVRSALGIRLEGEDVPRDFAGGTMLALYVECPDFYERTGVDRAWMYGAFNAQRRSAVIAVDGVDKFLFQTQVCEADRVGDSVSQERAQELFNEAFGGSCPITVLHSAYWHAGYVLVANSYGRGRVLIAGDAAHLFTPSGGLGYNTAVDDVVNLGWKLAAAVKGYGGPALISSYDIERRPIGIRNTNIARSFADGIGNLIPVAALDEDTPAGDKARAQAAQAIQDHCKREFNIPGVTFGVRYDGSPIVFTDAAPPPDTINEYIPSGVPGGRAPHIWTDGKQSLYDRFGRDFTLLCLAENLDTSAWSEIGMKKAVPLEILNLAGESCVGQARELYGADLVLIRPDLHIAWRGTDKVNPIPVLRRVLGWSSQS